MCVLILDKKRIRFPPVHAEKMRRHPFQLTFQNQEKIVPEAQKHQLVHLSQIYDRRRNDVNTSQRASIFLYAPMNSQTR